jgi:hypothetical protein
MRHFSRALNAELFKYRKRKRISLNGTIAGQTAGIYIGGLHYVTPPGSRSRGISPAQHRSIYDAPAFYEYPESDYEPPAPWFDQRPTLTPPIRIESPLQQPLHKVRYEDSLVTPELAEQAFDQAAQEALPDESIPLEPPTASLQGMENAVPGEGVDSLLGFAEMADAIVQLEEVLPPDHPDLVNLRTAAHEWLEHPEFWPNPEDFGADSGPSRLGTGNPYERAPYEDAGQAFELEDTSQMSQEMFDQAMVGPQMAHEPMAEALDPMQDAYEQQFEQGLEAIVQEPMHEQDPFEMQQRMYDEEMRHLMNPFMMPGPFGPGPMSPGP